MLRGYLLLWSLAGLGISVHSFVQIKRLYEVRYELAALEDECKPIFELESAIAQDMHQRQLLGYHLQNLNDLQPTNHLLDLFGVLGQATRLETGKLYIQRMTLVSGQSGVASSTPSSTTVTKPLAKTLPTTTTLSLGGLADDDAALTQFVASLRRSGVFDQVDLKASSQVAEGNHLSRQYQLECKYEDAP